MAATVAEIMSEDAPTAPHHEPRGRDLPTCAVCADTMVAAEASAFVTNDVVSYLWTCETCGYGFVTRHAFKQIVCN